MKLFKKIGAITVLILGAPVFFFQTTFAAIGTESGGGGDPQAVDFLLKTRVVAAWVKAGGGSLSEEKQQVVHIIAKKLTLMMDQASQTPIVMVNKNLVDVSGASKVALYSTKPFKIEVTRSKWKNLSEEEKYVTAGLELLGMAQVPERYRIAGLIQNDMQRVLQLSAIVGATKDFSGPQWAYFALAALFPEFEESIGGFSYEMNLTKLLCASSFTRTDGAPTVKTECTATDLNGTSITRSAPDLYLTLQIATGALPDTRSEPGTAYFELEDVNCGVLEPRTSNPNQPVKPDYFCSGKVNPPQK